MKGQEQTSSTIFVVGILVIVAATIAISFAGLDRINLPTGKKQAAEGSVEVVSRHLASLADRCWNQAGEGSAGRTIACFQVRVEPAGRIEPAAVTAKLDTLPPDSFSMEPIQSNAQTTVKITWDPGSQQVSITPFRVCDPSRGDTCELSKCNCDTACIPPSERPYDADGDGTADTNAYKCIEKEHFHTKGKGATCTFDFECRERLQCVNDGGTSTCQ